MVKIIEVADVKAPDNHAIIQVNSPVGILDIYQGAKDIMVFHVSKKLDSDEYWVIGETLSCCYYGSDFEEVLKNEAPTIKIKHGRGKVL
jgi:hypothetical protein